MKNSPFLKSIKKISIIFFALIGLIFAGVFFAMRFGLLNVSGSIEDRNKFFTEIDQKKVLNNQMVDTQRTIVDCESKVISKYNQILGTNILYLWDKKEDVNLTAQMINNAVIQIQKINPEVKIEIDNCSKELNSGQITTVESIYPWANTSDWSVIGNGLLKDSSIIKRVSQETGISARLIASVVAPEQFRFFSSNRESYKRYFEPLKILGTLTKFSLGVSGIKPDTATQIEKNILNPDSKFYLGPEYEHILDYPALSEHDIELYSRLTDSKNHYYQYLYTSLFIKQIETQWLNAGYDLSYRPDILATIFNLGFYRSNPSDHPEAGGAVIKIGDEEISFGQLSSELYFSGELINEFPY